MAIVDCKLRRLILLYVCVLIIAVTNPDAKRWYQSHLARLMDMGVDAFKTDFGERIPWSQVKFHDGSDPRVHHN